MSKQEEANPQIRAQETEDAVQICPVRRVQYVPPDAAVIEQFTRQVCDALVKQGRGEYVSQNVRWNIANLLKLVAELTSKQLNRSQTNPQE